MDRIDDLRLRLIRLTQNDSFNTDELREYRIHSEVFDITFPENNIIRSKPGRSRIIADGYWAFIRKSYFKRGQNMIEFIGAKNPYFSQVFYQLTMDISIIK